MNIMKIEMMLEWRSKMLKWMSLLMWTMLYKKSHNLNPSWPFQPEQPSNSEVEAPPHVVEDEVEPKHQSGRATEDPSEHTEVEPDPINIQMPLHPEDQSGRATEDVAEHTKLDPEPINMQIPLEPEPELTLKPWLHPEAEISAAKGTTESVEDMITGVLMRMNQENQGQEGNQNQQPEDQDQCNTPETAPASMEERCFI
ncbi:hypothetical protein PIB30_063567 [Stylosanthes scabra]|uniref:Uncharacterized protein n=1 Tax=Stylosanthes scabra TaxID=79078 RepID=A0ABU6WLG1_9FABA|nr:hypothetical protein [Stylosanthes scabra]